MFSVALLLALFACVLWARAVHAQPVDAGEEPAGGPIVYDLIPTQDAIVAQEELARAGATSRGPFLGTSTPIRPTTYKGCSQKSA